MNIIANHVFIKIKAIIILCLMNSQILLGLKHNLFGSLSQLELLWKNDVHIVKMMETLIKENISDYSPLKKYKEQYYYP